MCKCRKIILGLCFFAALCWAVSVSASDVPPWREADDLPFPDEVKSGVVERPETAIMAAPSVSASRRGTAMQGAKLPLFGAKRGAGCAARWLNVGPEAWICQDALMLDPSAPIAAGEGA